jgi:hypothetical protein
MIQWTPISDETPEVMREFIAFNPDKTSRHKSKTYKFSKIFSQERIKQDIIDDGFIQWAYIE